LASPRIVLASATAAQSSVSLIGFGLPSIGPELREEFGLSLTTLGAVLTASLLGSGLFLIVAGVLLDRYGNRRVTFAGTAVAVGGLVAAALSSTVPLLIAMLFLSGVGSSIIPIAGIGALFRVFPPERRAWALGVRQAAVPVGGVVAAVVLPPLAHAGGAGAALLFTAGMVAICGTAFALLGGGETLESVKRPRAELPRILRLPGMARLLVVAALYIVVLQSVLVFAVPSARDAGLSRFAAGAVFFAIQISAGVARIAWGRIADRDGGGRRVRALVEAGWVAAAGSILFVLALNAGPAAVIPAAFAFAFGALGWNALIYVRAGEMAPPGLAAQAVAIAASAVFCFSAVTLPPLGTLAEEAGFDVLWLTCGVLAAAGALVAGTLRPSRPEALAERR
jgi:MFS family permease